MKHKYSYYNTSIRVDNYQQQIPSRVPEYFAWVYTERKKEYAYMINED